MHDPVDDGDTCRAGGGDRCSDALSIILIGAPGGPDVANMSATVIFSSGFPGNLSSPFPVNFVLSENVTAADSCQVSPAIALPVDNSIPGSKPLIMTMALLAPPRSDSPIGAGSPVRQAMVQ
jgi:hypothetical protein